MVKSPTIIPDMQMQAVNELFKDAGDPLISAVLNVLMKNVLWGNFPAPEAFGFLP